MTLGFESSDVLASFYGAQELLENKILTQDQLYDKINKVTTTDILQVSKDIFVDWIIFVAENDSAVISLDKEKVLKYLNELADILDRVPQEPKAEFDDSRAVVFEPPQNGLSLDKEAVYSKIVNDF